METLTTVIERQMDFCLKELIAANSFDEVAYWQAKLGEYRTVYLKRAVQALEEPKADC